MEAVANRAHEVRPTRTPRSATNPGEDHHRGEPGPMASQSHSRHTPSPARRLLRLARPRTTGRQEDYLIHRTAVYGPVRTVVWEGRSREAPPYPDRPGSTPTG